MRQRIVVGAAAAGLVVVGLVGAGLVVANRGGDGAQPPPIVLGPAQGSAASGGGGASDEAKLAVGSSAIDPASMPIYRPSFTVTGQLPELGGTGQAWRLDGTFEPSSEKVTRLASAFGLTAAVEQVPADEGGGLRVGPSDGSAPVLYVNRGALGDWWFSGGPGEVSSGCARSIAPGEPTPGTTDITVEECAAPPPPAGVPSAAEAEQRARQVWEAMGYDPGSWSVSVEGDDYGRTAIAKRLLDGQPSSIWLYVTFGGGGAIISASGSLAEPNPVAQYPLVDANTALERLRSGDQRWFGGFGGGPLPMGATAKGGGWSEYAPTAVGAPDAAPAPTPVAGSAVAPPPAPAVGDPAVIPAVDPAIDPAVDPALPQPEPQVEPEPEQITGAERIVMMAWSPDGSVWLLPGYAFLTVNGGRWEILAVEEQYLQQAEAPTTTVAEMPSTIVPDTIVPDTTGPDSTGPDTTGPCPSLNGQAVPCANVALATSLVGATEADAVARAEAAGFTTRVAERDGELAVMTDDFSIARVNLVLVDGVVTAATIG